MNPRGFSSFLARTVACWNWKCALLSATARSIVYLAALARTRASGGLPIVLVEIVYVTLTAGLYAGLQQRALGFRSRILGNLTIALGVPLLAQTLDWFAHRAAGAAAPGKATLTVCVFAVVSALFHLYVMRRGAFLTGNAGRSLRDDFRRMPRLILAFIATPVAFLINSGTRLTRSAASEAAL
jgi:hypothetical protein